MSDAKTIAHCNVVDITDDKKYNLDERFLHSTIDINKIFTKKGKISNRHRKKSVNRLKRFLKILSD